MIRLFLCKLRWPLLGGAAAALVVAATSLGGSGVGATFSLGRTNKVNATSILKGSSKGSELMVSNTSTGSSIGVTATSASATSPGISAVNKGGGPALQAWVASSSVAPFTVNSTHVVANLHAANSDALGGHDSSYFLPTTGTAANSSALGGHGSSYFLPTTGTAANSSALGGLGASAYQERVGGTCSAGSAVQSVNPNGTVGCGTVWALGGNSGTNPATDYLGTSDNQAFVLGVNGQQALQLEPGSDPGLVGGYSGNSLTAGVLGATIAGGGDSALHAENRVTDSWGTVGGGKGNTAGDNAGTSADQIDATVAGGAFNTASGDTSAVGGGFGNLASAFRSVVAGGSQNVASGQYSAIGGGSQNGASGQYSAIGGGIDNTVSGAYSTVAGGSSNTAGGADSTVAGGYSNAASGSYSTVAGGNSSTASGNQSFAAGTHAKATQAGSFVWGDGTFADLTSPAANTFTVRASGGIWLGTNSSPSITSGHFIDTSTGAYLSSGGAWTNNSDRAKKHDFRPLNPFSVLGLIAHMPITSWSYKAEKPATRHIGPTAQDFYKAFHLGLDDKHITTIDEGGVALAAIKGLYLQNRKLERRNHSLNARLTRLERAVAKLSRSRR